MFKTIALDAMGGDFGPEVVVPAALNIAENFDHIRLILVGPQDILLPYLNHKNKSLLEKISIHHASQIVAMDEQPALALRNKKDSSLRVSLDLVKSGQAQACVSAGNTGALMVTARYVLKTLPYIDRPAIMTTFPNKLGRQVRVLDLGANVDSSPEHLYQFAVMATVLAKAVDNLSRPRVALLNIGIENIKGNDLVKKAALIFEQSSEINFIGYVEGDAIFEGDADIIVCDGFVGNVALKACEGIAKLMAEFTKEEVKKNWWTKLMVLPSIPVLRKVIKRIDPDKHNGATFLGLNGTVVKSHGGANISGFYHAIIEAVLEAKKDIPNLIKSEVARVLGDQDIKDQT